MSIFVELTHRIDQSTPNRFTDFVKRYGECAVPLMEKCGGEVLGGWKWSTRKLFTDLLLVRFDSLADYQRAAAEFESERERGALAPLEEFGVESKSD